MGGSYDHIEAQSLHKEMHSCYAHIAVQNLCIRNGKFLWSQCSAQLLHKKREVPTITLKHNLCIKHVRLPILILKHNLGMRNCLQFLHTEFWIKDLGFGAARSNSVGEWFYQIQGILQLQKEEEEKCTSRSHFCHIQEWRYWHHTTGPPWQSQCCQQSDHGTEGCNTCLRCPWRWHHSLPQCWSGIQPFLHLSLPPSQLPKASANACCMYYPHTTLTKSPPASQPARQRNKLICFFPISSSTSSSNPTLPKP